MKIRNILKKLQNFLNYSLLKDMKKNLFIHGMGTWTRSSNQNTEKNKHLLIENFYV